MKLSILSFIFALSSISFSTFALEQCPVEFGKEDYLEKVADLAANAPNCYEASEIVDTCALGGSGDVYTVSAAISRCEKDIPAMSKKDQQIYDNLNSKCSEKYEPMEGTLYQSMNAFCHLSVTKLFSELLSKEEDSL